MRTRDERGSLLPVMAALFTVLLLIAAMAVDLGVQRSARRDMQALADIVALDLARLLDGRSAADIRAGAGGKTPLEDAKSASLARNKDTIIGDDPSACTDGACVRAYLVAVDEDGNYSTTGGVPQEVSTTDVPNGVVVVASTEVGFAFSGLVGVGEGGASRSALGIAQSSACYQLGSYVASISPSSSEVFGDLLKPILGASTLSAVGYNGLASAKVSLFDLIHAPSIGVGTVDELLAMPSLTVADLFLASAYVLTGQGKIAEAEVFTLASTSVIAPFVLDFNDILAIDGSSDAVLHTYFNALDLLVGTAFLANGENLLDIQNLQAKLASVGVTNTELKIIEKARRWCTGYSTTGPETSQLKFKSTIKVETDNSPLLQTPKSKLRLIDIATGQPNNGISLSLNVDLAGARAVLTSASCNPDVFDIDVWTNLLTASLTGTAYVGGEITGTVDLGLLGVVDVKVPVTFGVTVSASAFEPAATEPEHVQLSYPPLNYGDYVSVGSGDVVLPDASVTLAPGTLDIEPVSVEVENALGVKVTVQVPQALLDGVVNPVIANLLAPTGALVDRFVPIVQPLVDKINDILVQLNAALGMNLGGADVYAMEAPTCNAPKLAG